MLEDVLKSIQSKRSLIIDFQTQSNKEYKGSIESVPLSVMDS